MVLTLRKKVVHPQAVRVRVCKWPPDEYRFENLSEIRGVLKGAGVFWSEIIADTKTGILSWGDNQFAQNDNYIVCENNKLRVFPDLHSLTLHFDIVKVEG